MKSILLWIVRLLTRVFYRVETVGAHHLPASGPALLLSNHMSYLDPGLIGVAVKRPIRFLMWREVYETWGVGSLARIFGAVPVERSDTAAALKESLHKMVAGLKAGETVCLFPEGAISRTGHVMDFKRGFELIARRAGVPIIPMHLDGVWGSIYSFERGKFYWKWPKNPRRHITVSFGAPMAPDSTHEAVRQAVLELGCEAYRRRKPHQRPVHVQFWRAARRRWRRHCLADSTGLELSWGRALAGSLALARWMRRRCAGERMVGLMLPASVAGALANVAAPMAGKVPINLNFTTARASLEVAIERCELKTILTSRKLVERAGLPERSEYVYMEDVFASIPRATKFWCLLLCAVVPYALARRWLIHHGTMDDIATIIFTSGSTGRPKGVVLTQQNIACNVQAMAEILQFGPTDAIMGVLPPFHSFGLTTTLWVPLTQGVPVAYHPNPLDGKGVGRMVEKYRSTLIMATPSFYALYARACKATQFRSLRLAVAGGQKLMPSVAKAFKAKFGLPLSEGYGCTELSPVVSTNVPDVREGEITHFASRDGSVGRPLPGLAIRLLDPETLQPAARGESGIVLVKGPSVMQGYLDDPEATAEVIRDGWYTTGDIGALDEDGFLYIQDRISRFSKIGGEMVPHGGVEEALEAAAGDEESRFCVLSMPDPAKGEKLVVIYSGPEIDSSRLLRAMSEAGLPNLWLPSRRDFFRVEEIPIMASGKTHLVEARRLAQEAMGSPHRT